MLDLDFAVDKAEPVPFAAAPQLAFKLRVRAAAAGGEPAAVHTVVLRCQIRIEPGRRRYVAPEQERLRDLFDTPDRWGQTLRALLWTHTSAVLPPFTGETVVDLPVPCTYDFNIAATRYFYALEDGEVPLVLLFSGTIFHEGEDGALQVSPISWEKEASFRLPVRVWQEMMELYYPNSAWLCLRRDVFERLYRYKRLRGLPTWEQALEGLLSAAGERVAP
jgi:hypothetical protein